MISGGVSSDMMWTGERCTCTAGQTEEGILFGFYGRQFKWCCCKLTAKCKKKIKKMFMQHFEANSWSGLNKSEFNLDSEVTAWFTPSCPGQGSCSSEEWIQSTHWPGWSFAPPQCRHTEPDSGDPPSLCPAGSAPGSINRIINIKNVQITENMSCNRLHRRLKQPKRSSRTLFLISRTSFGLVFKGMNWFATAAWRSPSSFVHCKHQVTHLDTHLGTERKKN